MEINHIILMLLIIYIAFCWALILPLVAKGFDALLIGGKPNVINPSLNYPQSLLPSYSSGGYNPGEYPSGGYNPGGYPSGGYNPGGYPQGGYSQGGYPQGGYSYKAPQLLQHPENPEQLFTMTNGNLISSLFPGLQPTNEEKELEKEKEKFAAELKKKEEEIEKLKKSVQNGNPLPIDLVKKLKNIANANSTTDGDEQKSDYPDELWEFLKLATGADYSKGKLGLKRDYTITVQENVQLDHELERANRDKKDASTTAPKVSAPQVTPKL